jgi:hypothetical protein
MIVTFHLSGGTETIVESGGTYEISTKGTGYRTVRTLLLDMPMFQTVHVHLNMW